MTRVLNPAMSTAEPQHHRLTLAEKALMQQMNLSPKDRLLDLFLRDGSFPEHLRHEVACTISCVSDRLDEVYSLREALPDCEVSYSSREDIPWYDEIFDKAVLRYASGSREQFVIMMDEVCRVLKPGGQFFMLLSALPRMFVSVFAPEDSDSDPFECDIQQVEQILQGAGFTQLRVVRGGPTQYILQAEKRSAECAEDSLA